ncbi:glycosyltransferase involved in cell wall biosynthesis [Litorivivens lipolytica]|uniref:Glycosyltransferase involved in cell wall biosynthesis n=1 Tax=Litorivivens lipolytica TaxID=1524264 RepID=A0A7W4W554_9GAMM|nr:glycosyltransferase [Litorivivens lipolytica]MBB3047308.1 glycosyltransferase involved in cell wall biosynthesis [Litorivivens lipolytica]
MIEAVDENKNPLISVVLISYNGARYIGEQIRSVLSQDYPNIEVVISDDGSNDETLEIVNQYAAENENVRVYPNEGRRGIHGNLSNGLSKARGQIIAICDQDDIWHTEKLSILNSYIQGFSASYCDSALIDEVGHPIGITMSQFIGGADLDIGTNYKALMMDNCVSGHAMLFRRELLASVLPFADVPMYDQQIALVAASENGIAYVDRELVLHRQHESNSNNQIVAKKVSRRDTSRNRKKLVMLRETSKLLSRSCGSVSLRSKDRSRFHAIERHLDNKFLEGPARQTFDLKLFILLLPIARSLFYFSSRKSVWLKRLYRLCRY